MVLLGKRLLQAIINRIRKKPILLLLSLFLFVFILCIPFIHSLYWPRVRYMINQVGYFTRPFWDKPSKPFTILPHYDSPNLTPDQLCSLHGWSPYGPNEKRPLVYDAILFSVELDILEIRLRELQDVVDHFLIVESDRTFTGKPKPLLFEQNKDRFAFIAHKIHYKSGSLRPLRPGEDPFDLEGLQRGLHMNALMDEVGIARGDWILMMDVDEIPSARTISLLKACQHVPSPLHFQLRNYLYSFEFLVDMDSWRGKAVKAPAYYGHSRVTDLMLADSGWHCSFCFRYLEDFVFKMSGYSHADRVHAPYLLDLKRIQDVICRGADIYDMLPEAYTYKDLMAKWGDITPSQSGIGLPSFVVENRDRFSYLLPGGCLRNSTRS